jgi:hypothetical protein
MRHYNPVLHGTQTAWADQNRRFKGGGGSSGPTQTNVQNTNIPEYAQPYVESMLGAAQQQFFNVDPSGTITGFDQYRPYSTNPADYVAPFSPLQNQAFQSATNLQTPGQYQAGSILAGASGLGSLGMAGQLSNTGAQYQQMATNPNSVQAYMNPYIGAALDPQIQAMRREYGVTGAQQQGNATKLGAFGGSREALMASENQRAMNSAIDSAIKQGYDKAFQSAQQAQQFGANLGLQGNQAALSGFGQVGQAGATLGALGTQQLAGQQGILNTQSLMGAQQQQQQQNIMNQAIQDYATAQQYPMMNLSNMSSLLRGLPLQSTATSTYQAAPSSIAQIAGLGTGIAGIASLMKAKGGVVKSYAKGGVTSIANREAIAEDLSAGQLQQALKNGTIPEYIGVPLLQDKLRLQQVAQAAAARQEAEARRDQPTIADEIMREAQGIDAASSGMSSNGFASGGIVAFAQGDLVQNRDKFSFNPEDYKLDTSIAKQLYEESLNPATGKRFTEQEIIAKQRAKEEGLGIKDIYKGQLEELQKEKAGLESQKDRALGLSLLSASGKMLGSTSPFALTGIGEGLGEFSTKYGSALDKIDANKIAMRKDENAIMAAQQQMKQAQMAGDSAAFKAAEDRYTSLITNYSNAQNENVKLAREAKLEGSKAEYDRGTKVITSNIDKEAKIAAAKASQSPFTGETNARVSLTARAELINKHMDDLVASSGADYNRAKRSPTAPGNAKVIADYEAKQRAIYQSVRAQFDPIIKDQLSKLGKSEQEINDMINAIDVEAVAGNAGGGAGNAGGTGGVMKFDAKGNPVK